MSALLPCWSATRLESVFRLQAADMSRHDFLASHTPMRHLTGDGLFPKGLDEETVLEEVRRNDREHSLIVVRGGPGGGKSHLVRWLQFRLEPFAADENLEIIFVERKNSTLRGVIEQVAAHTREYAEVSARLQEGVGRLNQAGRMGRIKDEWAREIDRHQIRSENLAPDERRILLNEAGVSWGDLFRNDLARAVLDEKEGFFTRIARQIGIEASEGTERMSDPGLRSEDLRRLLDVPTKDYRRKGTARAAEARDFLEAILADQIQGIGLRELLQVLNNVMGGVVRSTLNISRSDFEDIFRKIRRSIFSKDPNRRLVLLIEDLFPFKHLDEALMNALIEERKAEEPIARLTTVVGMTTGYWEDQIVSGRAHIAQRVTHQVVVPVGDAVDLSASGGAARFVSRYLNIVRHRDPATLKTWADQDPANPPPSACANCPHPAIRDRCLSTFGAIGDGTEAVGLFPFTDLATTNLAGALREGGLSTPSPRLLVIHALYPFLREALAADVTGRAFPNPELFNVRMLEFPEFENPSLKESLAGAFPDVGDRLSASWLVRSWGDTSKFRTPGKLGDVPLGVFHRFGLVLPDHVPSEAPHGPKDTFPSPVGEPPTAPVGDVDARSNDRDREPEHDADRPKDKDERPKPKPRSKPDRSVFNPKTWLTQESIPDARKLAQRALADAIDFVPDHVTLSLRERLRPSVLFVEGQQSTQQKGTLVVKRNDVAADGLAAVQDLGRMREGGPSPSTLRHLRAFRREYAPQVSTLLIRRECGDHSPEVVGTASAWVLLLDGILRQRVDCSAPPSQWFFWSLSTLDADNGEQTELPGFDQIAQVLGQRTDRFRRQRLRDLWHRLAVVPRGDTEKSPAAFYSGLPTLNATSMFLRGEVPSLLSGSPLEPNEYLDLQEALAKVQESFAAAVQTLSKAASVAHQRLKGGADSAAAAWRESAIALCTAAKKDSEDDSLVQRAIQFEKHLGAWLAPSADAIQDWSRDLAVLGIGTVNIEFWRSAFIFTDPIFRSFDKINLEMELLIQHVKTRQTHFSGSAPVADAFQRVRTAAVALRDLLKPPGKRQ